MIYYELLDEALISHLKKSWFMVREKTTNYHTWKVSTSVRITFCSVSIRMQDNPEVFLALVFNSQVSR